MIHKTKIFIPLLTILSFSSMANVSSNIENAQIFCSNSDGTNILTLSNLDNMFDGRYYSYVSCRTNSDGNFAVNVFFRHPTTVNSINFRLSPFEVLDDFSFGIKQDATTSDNPILPYTANSPITGFTDISSFTFYGRGLPLTPFTFDEMTINGTFVVPPEPDPQEQESNQPTGSHSVFFFKLPKNVINKNL